MKEILISILVSLVASFIWWLLGQAYAFDSRKKINTQLMLLLNDNYSYQKFLEQKDYDLALNQCQRILGEVGEIYSLIKPLTYLPRKRKLIKTVLNSVYHKISYFQRYYEGYEKKEIEKEACCEKAARHLYVVGYEPSNDHRYPDYTKFQSASEVAINLLAELNQRRSSCKKILATAQCFNGTPKNMEVRKKYLLDMVCVESFKDSYSKDIAVLFQPSRDVLYKQKYEEIIKSLPEKPSRQRKKILSRDLKRGRQRNLKIGG